MLKKIFKRSVWGIITLFFVILMSVFIVLKDAVVPYERWIDNYLHVRRTFLVDEEPEEGAEPQDTQYFKSRFTDPETNELHKDEAGFKKMYKNFLEITERVNEEGIVLLWNENGALPLSSDERRVSTFGVHGLAYNDGGNWYDYWIYHGTGSANIDLRQDVGINKNNGAEIGPRLSDSLVKRGFTINQPLVNATWNNLSDKTNPQGYTAVTNGLKRDREEVSWQQLTGDAAAPLNEIKPNDVAIYTIGRYEGEGGYVKDKVVLTEQEKTVLQGLTDLKKAGKVKKVILLICFPNPMDMAEFKDYSVDACLWVGYGGNTSTEAVCDILTGAVNPSGRLPDTWAYTAESAPAAVNYDAFSYGNSSVIKTWQDNGVDTAGKYIAYQEGIYVGYRYYETRYEDLVLGNGNASANTGVVNGSGNWNYRDEVRFPFGYGLSYTTFSYSDLSVDKADDEYTVSVTVKNEGQVAGKTPVQVYLQKPYTQYDKDNGIEKAAVELVGFEKTDVIQPGKTETVTVTVPEYELKSYDSYGKKTYILENGTYYFAVGSDAHDAVNNILAAKGKTSADGMTAAGDGNLAAAQQINNRSDVTLYSESPTGYTVKNAFDDVDINLYAGTKDQKITYLSRKDWRATYPTKAVSLTANATIAADIALATEFENDPNAVMPVFGKESEEYGHLNLIQLKDVPFEDPLWDDFLNQLTFEEQASILSGSSMRPIESAAVPEGHVYDGPCGFRDAFNGIGDFTTRCAFPCSPIVAATFNEGLIAEMAEIFGEVAYGADGDRPFAGVWGVSANIHRLPYNGRNWEYYSEDGFLTGKMTAVETEGLNKKGILVYNKHFALNEIETNRNGIGTWANEQTIREIYLKGFEASVTEAHGNGIMTSYNRIGCKWTGMHKGLLTEVLQKEWGFKGVTATDYCTWVYMGSGQPMTVACALIAGQDEWIADIGFNEDVWGQFKTNATFCTALRESVHRNLYTRVHTVAMNGVGANTKVVIIIPEWQLAIEKVAIAAGVVAGVCAAMTLASWIIWAVGRRKEI